MTRIPCRSTAIRGIMRPRQTFPKASARKHKIILESVTQEKKKLRIAISFDTKPPPGYTFIPAGNPGFTNGCKELCRKDGFKIFTVSTTPHQRAHDLSQQVHRIGYHFPSVVVATICMERGLFLSSSGRVVAYQNHRPGETQGNKGASSEQSQDTINAEARDAIKDLFPNIPTKDLNQIVKTAFKKGKRRVGTAVELPLARRAQLAVVAHIRHIYTSYDRLLKMTSFQEARASVEEPTLAKLVLWRGDDENGATVLEDVFREVIVISDDEDDDQDDGEETELPPPPHDNLRENMEQASKTTERETQPTYGTPRDNFSINRSVAPQTTRHGPSTPSCVIVDPPSQYRERRNNDHRGFRRYEAWDRARNRYNNCENGASFVPAIPEPREQYSPRFSRTESRPEFLDGEGHRVRLSPARDSTMSRTTDHIRKEVVTDYAQQMSTYTPTRLTTVKEREPQHCHHRLSEHASFPPVVERTQAYVYRQSPLPSNLHRANQVQSRRSYPPSDNTRYGIAHPRQPQPHQGPIIESRDYPVIPSIETPMAPTSRPERQDDIRIQSSKVIIPGPPTSRGMRPLENEPHPQLEIYPRQERHWDDLSYSRANGTPQRLPTTPRNVAPAYSSYGLHLDRETRSPPVASQYQQPLRNIENLTRPPLGQRAVRASHQGLGDPERYTHRMTEHIERGVSHPAVVANPADPRRIPTRYPYPENPAIVIRQRHSMNSRLVAYPADPPTDAGNRLAQVRVYDRPVETHTAVPDEARYQARLPLESRDPLQQSNRFATVDKPYTYYVDNDHPPGNYPGPYRSPPPEVHSLESTPTISHTLTAPQLGPTNGYIRSHQPHTHRGYL